MSEDQRKSGRQYRQKTNVIPDSVSRTVRVPLKLFSITEAEREGVIRNLISGFEILNQGTTGAFRKRLINSY